MRAFLRTLIIPGTTFVGMAIVAYVVTKLIDPTIQLYPYIP
jgi:hypothetical protein